MAFRMTSVSGPILVWGFAGLLFGAGIGALIGFPVPLALSGMMSAAALRAALFILYDTDHQG